MSTPSVFISYSHDGEEHKAWALRLATGLRTAGVDASLDQWDLVPGQDLAVFAQHGITAADRVLLVCSDSYITKAGVGLGGVGYDLADRPANGTPMSRGKPVQDGMRVKLPDGMTWEKLATLSPEGVREKQLWPAGFLPLLHPHHEVDGMVSPNFLIEEMKQKTNLDLTRKDGTQIYYKNWGAGQCGIQPRLAPQYG